MSTSDDSTYFKFCILAAGRGTRSTALSGLHKALFPVGNRPVISIILDRVPKSIPIVVALGHKSEQIRSYLLSVHHDRSFEFVQVENYLGLGSGPGLSLLKCEKNMQCPFIFTSADTIVDEDFKFSAIAKNWVGVSQVSDSESHEYCLVSTADGVVNDFFYGKNKNSYAFTGIAGVKDFKEFWNGLKQGNIIKGEHQVLDGLRALNNLHTLSMSWLDTGNDRAYSRTKSFYPNDLVVEKKNESIFVDNGSVVKYFDDADKARQRVQRSDYLIDCSPKVSKVNDNMFLYSFHEGQRLSDVNNERQLYEFLLDYHQKFGKNRCKSDSSFFSNCDKMYRQKTLDRIKQYADGPLDKISSVNGIQVSAVMNLIDQVDWEKINEKAIASKFHGDLQPENILVLSSGDYLYIDWRESFGESISVGDMYYDLGKLYHALIVSNSLVLEGNYDIFIDHDLSKAEIYFAVKSNLIKLNQMLQKFCLDMGLEYRHVELVGILNYLNIAGLYGTFQNGDYGNFLFLLGKKMLTQWIEEGK